MILGDFDMTKQIQTSKNLKLSAKVAEYITKNPDSVKDFKGDLSFVVFSASDSSLNKVNTNLAIKLKKEGKKVIKAEETKDKESPWKFTPLSA